MEIAQPLDEIQGITEKTSEYIPRTTAQTRLIGRPLQTADAPHQTIGTGRIGSLFF
jgi:hypothetical protein